MSDPWYRRYAGNFLIEAAALSLEEKGAFTVLIDLVHSMRKPVPDQPRMIAGICGCSVYRWKQLRASLIEQGKVVLLDGALDVPIVHRWAGWSGREAIPAHVRREVVDRDGDRCVYCGATEGPFHLDHVLPVSRGGRSQADNLVVACVPCNLSKGARTPEEWAR